MPRTTGHAVSAPMMLGRDFPAYLAMFPIQTSEDMPPPNGGRGYRPLSAVSEAGAPREKLAGRRILIVEDEMFIALDLELSIEDVGGVPVGPIQTVEDGMEFLEDCDEVKSLAAAILDINLHGHDVFPIARMLLTQGIPFVFHTGHGNREELKDQWASVPVCQKPIHPNRLLDYVAGLINE